MRVVIAPDSFKESMTALEASKAIKEGFSRVFPHAEYTKIPMADGGEGTVQSVVDATGGRIKKLTVQGPLGDPIDAFYGISGNGKLAIIEMAASSGLDKVPPHRRNPLITSTWGFGELIEDALNEGVEELILGIGGSATNDAGAGMLMSLGGKLLDSKGKSIVPTGQGLADLYSIEISNVQERFKDIIVRVACDVNNPLTGPNGASQIYGPQKGANEDQVIILDNNLKHFSTIVSKDLGIEINDVPGSGAAGGLGGGLMAFLGGTLEEGGKLIVDILELEKHISQADLVITGEGGINHQTIFGKTPIAVSRIADKYNVPTIALAGKISGDYKSIFGEGIDAVFSILSEIYSIDEALRDGQTNIRETAENVARVLKLNLED